MKTKLFLKAIMIRLIILLIAIGMGYLLVLIKVMNKIDWYYISGVLLVILFSLGRDYQRCYFE